MEFTAHGQARCRQRGIGQDVVEVLMEYGESGRHKGADVMFMDRQSRLRARRALGQRVYARIADRLNAYLVISDEGRIISTRPGSTAGMKVEEARLL